MKKIFSLLFVAAMITVAACQGKTNNEAAAVDSTATMSSDSAATMATDSAATMATDSAK